MPLSWVSLSGVVMQIALDSRCRRSTGRHPRPVSITLANSPGAELAAALPNNRRPLSAAQALAAVHTSAGSPGPAANRTCVMNDPAPEPVDPSLMAASNPALSTGFVEGAVHMVVDQLDAAQVIRQLSRHVRVHPAEHVGQFTSRHTGTLPRPTPKRGIAYS